MNLKGAFRFQNKLGSLMEEAQGILSRDANITRVENTYLRKKVFDGAENETVVDTPPTEFADRITDIVRFLVFLMEQREVLSKAMRCRTLSGLRWSADQLWLRGCIHRRMN